MTEIEKNAKRVPNLLLINLIFLMSYAGHHSTRPLQNSHDVPHLWDLTLGHELLFSIYNSEREEMIVQEPINMPLHYSTLSI